MKKGETLQIEGGSSMGKGPEVGGNIEDGWQKARVPNEISTSQASSFLPSLCASIFRCSCLFHSSEMTNQTLPFCKGEGNRQDALHHDASPQLTLTWAASLPLPRPIGRDYWCNPDQQQFTPGLGQSLASGSCDRYFLSRKRELWVDCSVATKWLCLSYLLTWLWDPRDLGSKLVG